MIRSPLRALLPALLALAACKEKAAPPAPPPPPTPTAAAAPTSPPAPEPSAAAPLRVGAASDLAFAFKEVGAVFEQKTGTKVDFTFGSTGQLAKQIAEGAPFDLFAAANVSFVDQVIAADACDPATRATYAFGRIVAWSRQGGVAPPVKVGDLADERFVKIAIANPEHAPYGKAAQQALESAKIWDKVKPRVVFGENVQQTLQFAQTGNAEVAIAALSLAIASEGGTYFTIDAALHQPLEQALVVCKHGKNAAAAREFASYVNSEEGRAIMRRFGFLLPGEALAEKR